MAKYGIQLLAITVRGRKVELLRQKSDQSVAFIDPDAEQVVPVRKDKYVELSKVRSRKARTRVKAYYY